MPYKVLHIPSAQYVQVYERDYRYYIDDPYFVEFETDFIQKAEALVDVICRIPKYRLIRNNKYALCIEIEYINMAIDCSIAFAYPPTNVSHLDAHEFEIVKEPE